MGKSKEVRRGKGSYKKAAGHSAGFRRSGSGSQAGAGIDSAGEIVVVIDYGKAGDSIGVRYGSNLEAVDAVIAGLPFDSIGRFRQTSGLTLERIKQVAGISEGSYARRRQKGRLSLEESERLMRVGRMFERATALYEGDQEGAREWLETSIPALGDQRPLDLAKTEPGAREVEDFIGRIEQGIVS
jgi:putative toxin-antitoxin system antitoxin component (TIGR02293 family)